MRKPNEITLIRDKRGSGKTSRLLEIARSYKDIVYITPNKPMASALKNKYKPERISIKIFSEYEFVSLLNTGTKSNFNVVLDEISLFDSEYLNQILNCENVNVIAASLDVDYSIDFVKNNEEKYFVKVPFLNHYVYFKDPDTKCVEIETIENMTSLLPKHRNEMGLTINDIKYYHLDKLRKIKA